MINYFSVTKFELKNPDKYTDWIIKVIEDNLRTVGELTFIFCDDDYLLKINRDYLHHDYYTDIITFPYNRASEISGDIFISVERVRENANGYGVNFYNELSRVMIHGVLHLLGWEDDSEKDKAGMRAKEDQCLKMFHVKQ